MSTSGWLLSGWSGGRSNSEDDSVGGAGNIGPGVVSEMVTVDAVDDADVGGGRGGDRGTE